MRTRINVDSVSPLSAHLLTLAYQRTKGLTPLSLGRLENEPTVQVLGSAMTWLSPPITTVHAAAMLAEYHRLLESDGRRLANYHNTLVDAERMAITTVPPTAPALTLEATRG